MAPGRLIRVIRFIRGFYLVVDKHHAVKELGLGTDEILRAALRFELFVLRINNANPFPYNKRFISSRAAKIFKPEDEGRNHGYHC